MFPYDDTARTVIRVAGDEANRLGAPGYDSCQVVMALLQTRDPVTRRVTQADSRVPADVVRDRLGAAVPAPDDDPLTAPPSAPVPPAEFREATRRFTAKWRPLGRARRLPPGPRLGTGALWLAVLEPGTAATQVLRSVGADLGRVREVVLATMVPDFQPVPAWPSEVPDGAVPRLIRRVLGRDTRT